MCIDTPSFKDIFRVIIGGGNASVSIRIMSKQKVF